MGTVTIAAYVRTTAGVVRVVAGGRVPSDALPSDVDRLVAAGVITPDPVIPPTGTGQVPTVDDVLAAVGDDVDKAKAALAVETGPDGRNRKTLVEPLQAIIANAAGEES